MRALLTANSGGKLTYKKCFPSLPDDYVPIFMICVFVLALFFPLIS